MSYQVLARKWRPRSFREMVGQTHVLRALISALDTGRLHHAYLFTGTRGVGKTTIARIMAKCLNCEQGVSSTPCGECSICREIDEGRFVDLIEVDAASKTKVEDTRELLDNVQYMPGRGRYKVYLIDEVHMLSTSSFNALLKTLEEPPGHVKFLLATTDPQKLPATVLSRCLQFSLKNMPPEAVVGHLSHVLDSENVPFEEQALWLLGRAADGSMRDAMSLTDQAVAFGEGKVLAEDVRAMLGTLDQGQVFGVLQALADGDARAMLQAIRQLADHGPDWMGVLGELLGVLHRTTVAQMLPDAVDNSQGDQEQILQLAQALPPEDVQFYYQVALLGRRDLPLAPDARDGFEMVMLRMLAFRPASLPGAPRTPLVFDSTADAAGSGDIKEATAKPETAVKSEATTAGSEITVSETESTIGSGAAVSAPADVEAQQLRETVPAAAEPDQELAPWEAAPDETPKEASEAPVESEEATEKATAEALPEEEAGASTSVEAGTETATEPQAAGPRSVEPATERDEPFSARQAGPPRGAAGDEKPVVAAKEAGQTVRQTPAGSAVIESAAAGMADGLAAQPATAIADVVRPASVAEAADVQSDPDEQDEDQELAALQDDLAAYASWHPAAEELLELQQDREEGDTDLRPDIPAATGLAARWIELCEQMGLTGITGTIVRHTTLVAEEGDTWQLHLDPTHSALFNATQQKRINESVNQVLGREVHLQIEERAPEAETPALALARRRARQQADAVLSIEQDPAIQTLLREFGAKILPDSIRPHNPV